MPVSTTLAFVGLQSTHVMRAVAVCAVKRGCRSSTRACAPCGGMNCELESPFCCAAADDDAILRLSVVGHAQMRSTPSAHAAARSPATLLCASAAAVDDAVDAVALAFPFAFDALVVLPLAASDGSGALYSVSGAQHISSTRPPAANSRGNSA